MFLNNLSKRNKCTAKKTKIIYIYIYKLFAIKNLIQFIIE